MAAVRRDRSIRDVVDHPCFSQTKRKPWATFEARLRSVEGIGEATILDLKVVLAAGQRLARGSVMKRPVLSSWSAVLDYCRTAMAHGWTA